MVQSQIHGLPPNKNSGTRSEEEKVELIRLLLYEINGVLLCPKVQIEIRFVASS